MSKGNPLLHNAGFVTPLVNPPWSASPHLTVR